MARFLDVDQACDGISPEAKVREYGMFFTNCTREEKLEFLCELYGLAFLQLVNLCYLF